MREIEEIIENLKLSLQVESQATRGPWWLATGEKDLVMPNCCDARDPVIYKTKWPKENDLFIARARNTYAKNANALLVAVYSLEKVLTPQTVGTAESYRENVEKIVSSAIEEIAKLLEDE